MDERQRRDATQLKALIIKDYGSSGPEYAELDAVLRGLESELDLAHDGARRKDEEIAALKAERDLYLTQLSTIGTKMMDIVGQHFQDLALLKLSSDVRQGKSVLVPAPEPTEIINTNGATPNGGAQ